MRGPINDPTHWHKRADEARAQAAHMETEQRHRMMRQIANGYDLLAIRAQERMRESGTPNPNQGRGLNTPPRTRW